MCIAFEYYNRQRNDIIKTGIQPLPLVYDYHVDNTKLNRGMEDAMAG